MRITRVLLENFASYANLDFTFSDKGLILIHGPNGSGKSTLCDAIPWILFGRTSKNGAVDDILTWPGDKTAKGTIWLELNGQTLSITRSRRPNDLYIDSNGTTRGKDLPDTQRLINDLLGIDIEFFLASAYFHEFSQTASFFTTTPKIRRTICEQLVDLTLAKDLQAKAQVAKKGINTTTLENKITNALTKQTEIERWTERHNQKRLQLAEKHVSFEEDQQDLISRLQSSVKTFTQLKKARIDKLEKSKHDPICSECGADKEPNPEATKNIDKQIRQINTEPNPYAAQLQRELERKNTYLEQLEALDNEECPITNPGDPKELQQALAALTTQQNDLGLLSDVLDAFRSTSVKQTISMVEQQTNAYLDKHFDAELRVSFEVDTGDKVDVIIWKDGNTCAYTQLSKGQRRLLNLSFGVSVMRTIAQKHGKAPSVIAFDEALDGMDDLMKHKAYGLLQTLQADYETIMIVDHGESFKSLFSNRYRVSLADGGSQIYEET